VFARHCDRPVCQEWKAPEEARETRQALLVISEAGGAVGVPEN
jgi:hypothetical protein